jgi:hypothetical protein
MKNYEGHARKGFGPICMNNFRIWLDVMDKIVEKSVSACDCRAVPRLEPGPFEYEAGVLSLGRAVWSLELFHFVPAS